MAMTIRDVTPDAWLAGAEDDTLGAGLRRALADMPDVRVLPCVGLPAGGRVERLGTVVVHRRGLVVLHPTAAAGLGCLTGAAHGPVLAEPCHALVAVRRQAEALRAHLAARAASLLHGRLLPAVFAAALPVDALVVTNGRHGMGEAAVGPGDLCRALVLSPEGAEDRVRDLVAQPPRRDRLGRRLLLRRAEMAAVVDHLRRVHVGCGLPRPAGGRLPAVRTATA
ncbi:hypothetical protein [Caenispirillum bisanense]|nr:hypothetical protein [Caenispirillum bisanense]